MKYAAYVRSLWLPVTLFILYGAAVTFRPLLPIDETRYMSVAWEMFLRHNWLQPLTMNFEPYHHKPPLLFWLINASWGVFGVSRWAGLVPVVIMAGANIGLAGALGRLLFPDFIKEGTRVGLVMTASVPFLIYSTLILFDLTLSVFTLLALIGVVLHSRDRQWHTLAFIGLCMGLGVLTKGPVAYLYVVFPFALAPVWQPGFKNPGQWYAGMLAALLVSVIPVLCWLVPVLQQADENFAFWLVWEQTVGRVTGNFNDAHVRPFYFYLPLLPVMFMPWLFFLPFWRGVKTVRAELRDQTGGRFLLCWLVPTFICFCLISGKQPHYLVPLLPGTILLTVWLLRDLSTPVLARCLIVMVTLVVAGQALAAQTVFKSYDLMPWAAYMQTHSERDWAYVRNYHAEMGFLARLTKPMTDRQPDEISAWFAAYPNGLAMIRYSRPEDVAAYYLIMDGPYRGKRLGIFSASGDVR